MSIGPKFFKDEFENVRFSNVINFGNTPDDKMVEMLVTVDVGKELTKYEIKVDNEEAATFFNLAGALQAFRHLVKND